MKIKKLILGLFCGISVLSLVLVQTISPKQASAAQITARSLTLQAGATDGGSKPGGVVKHLFAFTIPTEGDISSLKFEYCTLAYGTCTTPAGLSTTTATIDNQTGITFSSIVNTTNGAPYLTAGTPITIDTGVNDVVTFQIGTVTNPDGTSCDPLLLGNCTFYVRLSTYASTDATGSPIDTGVVAASTTQAVVLTGIMPESLVFCTGGTVSTTASVPDCTTVTSGAISFNQLFSPQSTAYATSQMAASTNATSGYAITVNGTTLTSGANTIDAMSAADTSKFGVGQFGMNLMANATPNIGTDIAPASAGFYRGRPQTGYEVADTFKYTSGDLIADSGFGGSPAGTDAQIYTSSYIVNVPGHQPAGTYTTTLTYICTPTF